MSATSPVSRRELLCSAAATAAAASATALETGPASNRWLSGTVFHDQSASGVRRNRDPGVAGVLVSNGVDVTVTDSNGHWRLPARAAAHVFVIKPKGWALARRGNGLAAFALECGRTEGLDFALYPCQEPTSYEVALLADTQPQTMRELDYLRDTVLASVSASGAAFAINHGDIVFDAPELYDRYLQLVAASGMPWHHCPGNHDMDHVADPHASFATWRRVFGPSYYAFQHGDATFIILNNVQRLAGNELTASGHSYRGCVGSDQLAFVRNLLLHVPQEQLVVVSMHIPLVGFEDPDDPAGKTQDCEALLRLLSGRPNTVSFAGHTHTTEHHYLGATHGFSGPAPHHHHVLTAASGSWWSGPFDGCGLPIADSRDGTPKGYHLMRIDGHRYTTRFVPAPAQGNSSMRMSIEGNGHMGGASGGASPLEWYSASLSMEQLRDARLVVNVFDGGPRTRVSYRIADSRNATVWSMQMTRSNRVDPYTVMNYCRYSDNLKPWVQASVSSHLWAAQLPCDLGAGCYRIEVECSDEYAREHRSSILVEIFA